MTTNRLRFFDDTYLMCTKDIEIVKKAHTQGKQLQWKPLKVSYEPSWFDIKDPAWEFKFNRHYYRVKPTQLPEGDDD